MSPPLPDLWLRHWRREILLDCGMREHNIVIVGGQVFGVVEAGPYSRIFKLENHHNYAISYQYLISVILLFAKAKKYLFAQVISHLKIFLITVLRAPFFKPVESPTAQVRPSKSARK